MSSPVKEKKTRIYGTEKCGLFASVWTKPWGGKGE